jgi:hypothetical protein
MTMVPITIAVILLDEDFRTTSGRRDGEGVGTGPPTSAGTVQTFWQREQTDFAPATAFARRRMFPQVQQIVCTAMASDGLHLRRTDRRFRYRNPDRRPDLPVPDIAFLRHEPRETIPAPAGNSKLETDWERVTGNLKLPHPGRCAPRLSG